MPDEPDREPGGWELHRALEKLSNDVTAGLSGINARLDRLVSTELHAAEMRRVDENQKDLNNDIASEREARQSAVDDLQRQMREMRRMQLLIATGIIVPIVVFVASLLLEGRSPL